MIELPLIVEMEVETDAEYEMEMDSVYDINTSNLIKGSFVADNTHPWQDVQIPYDGSGYPIAITIYPKGGVYANESYSSTENGMALFSAVKSNTGVPDYTGGTATNNVGQYCFTYKIRSSFSASQSTPGRMYHNLEASASPGTCFHFRSANVINVYTGSSTYYTFVSGIEYEYIVLYSE